jgi:hypothetical protein
MKEEHPSQTSSLPICILPIISSILVFVQVLDIYTIIFTWKDLNLQQEEIYALCVRAVFSLFSLCSGLSALILTFFLNYNFEWFLEKILTSYMYFNYIVFGPYLLGFSLLGWYYYDITLYNCNKHNNTVVFSFVNIFSIFFASVLSLFITFSQLAYNIIFTYLSSIVRKPGGNKILWEAFWRLGTKNTVMTDILPQK